MAGLAFDPVWFTVLFAVCLQTSFLTPPNGGALFYLRGIAPPGIDLCVNYCDGTRYKSSGLGGSKGIPEGREDAGANECQRAICEHSDQVNCPPNKPNYVY